MRKLIFCTFCICFLLQPNFSSAQWTRTNGPYGGAINSMTYLSPYLYAASQFGLFRSTDNGLNWSPVEGLPEYDIRGLTARNGKLFIIGYSFGMFVTNDHCVNWDKAGVEIPVDIGTGSGNPDIDYYRLYSVGNYMYCFISGLSPSIYRSSDDGNSWQLYMNVLTNDFFQDGDTILMNKLNPKQTLRSIDNGQNWNTVSGLPNTELKHGKLNNVWVAQQSNASPGFYYSINGGATFSTGSGYSPSNPYAIVNSGTNLFSVASGGAIMTTSDGINWTTISVPPIPAQSGIFTNCFAFGNELWFCGWNKLVFSDDEGVTFLVRNKGITSNSGYATSGLSQNWNDSFLYITGNPNYGTPSRSSDHGETWTEFATGFPTNNINTLDILNVGTTYFAATPQGLYRSDDNAANWYVLSTTFTYPLCLAKGNTELYIGEQNEGVFKSQDGGTTWIPANAGITTVRVNRLTWHQNKLYAATNSPLGLYVTSDSGATWTSLTSSYVNNFNILEDSIITCILANGQVIRSWNSGSSWDTLNYSTPGVAGVAQMKDSVFFIAQGNEGVLMSNTNMNYWIPVNNGFTLSIHEPHPLCNEIAMDSEYLYANTAKLGVWRLPLDSIVITGQLSGKIYWDQNSDGIKQAIEPYLNDETVTVDPFSIAADTDTSGFYQYTYTGNNPDYTINFNPKPYWFVTSSSPSYLVTPLGNNIDSLDFGINVIGNVTDVKVDLASGTNRPGFNVNYLVTVMNIGTDTISDVVTVTLDNFLTYVSGSPPQSVNQNTFTYAYSNLMPGQSQMFYIIANLSSSTPLSTILNNSATVYPLISDTFPANNVTNHFPIVSGSYDPNNKVAEPAGNIAHQDLITYQINFQNTGTDTAFTVIVRDTVSPFLDLNTFSLIANSHPVMVSIKNGNVLEFRFDQILLPDSNTNEPGSHGMVRFSIRPVDGLPLNTTIGNTAAISFDYNVPIITNTITNTITGYTAVHAPGLSNEMEVTIQPNPFKQEAQLKIISSEQGPFAITVYNSIGKRIISESINGTVKQIQGNILTGGMYIYEVKSPTGKSSRGKFIVE